ncbi:MAG TPA: intradiol ring-cleavage dioxygenase [Candidatus Competibacteraceae bacterium]|nr:intradiol ring-cleavage dioxygenase [Candidatus Competibacteraceae bacterium]
MHARSAPTLPLRRRLLVAALMLPAVWLLSRLAAGQELPLTPECGDDEPTPRNPEGPFYTPRSPQRSSLREPGLDGTPLLLVGYVLSRGCQPVAGALVELWHCDAHGQYDNVGFRCRGHQYTDRQGRYRFETLVPGLYPGRTRHFHLKVQAPGGPLLTTQLYFPGEPGNARDFLFREALLMRLADGPQDRVGRFDFVVAAGG